MVINNNYYFLVKDIRELKRNYKNLDIDEKLKLLKLELKCEGKNIKVKKEFVSKSVKKKEKHEDYLRNNNKKVSRY